MISIGIVGTGIAGLQFGLLLQQRGIPATIYADRTPEQQRAGRILNNVVRLAHTRERERALGVNHWDSVGPTLPRSVWWSASSRSATPTRRPGMVLSRQ